MASSNACSLPERVLLLQLVMVLFSPGVVEGASYSPNFQVPYPSREARGAPQDIQYSDDVQAGKSGSPHGYSYPPGDPRVCLELNPSLNIMQVVPGVGWDNLRNLETGLVASFTYSQCQVTYDRKYLIPDNTFAIPQKTSTVEQSAEIIEHWDSHFSTTAQTINTGIDLLGKLGGKFSTEYKRVKSSQYREESFTARIELRHRFYTITQLPDSALHPGFKKRLLEIASYLKSNDSMTAKFLAEVLVRDFGTHYLSSVDAGAVLVQEDNLKRIHKTKSSSSAFDVSASAAASFFADLQLSAGTSFSINKTKLQGYRDNRTSSTTFSYGGPPYRLGMKAEDWESDLENNLVAIDRSGKPLFTLISSLTLQPEIENPSQVQELRLLLQDVIARYYGFNTHLGCTNPDAPNFDYQANSEAPGSCLAPAANHTFGGVFQQCINGTSGNRLCSDIMQKNPLTGDYSCPSEFGAVLLLDGEVRKSRVKKSCHHKKRCTLGFIACRNVEVCTYTPHTDVAKYRTYWCAALQKDVNMGYLFGGMYSNDIKNPITRLRRCPARYIELKFGSHAKVCVSEDYELGQSFSLPFGGFFSCKAGNVLTGRNVSEFLNNPSNWPMRCPPGFTQHLAMIENNCRVNFCVKAGSLLKHNDLDIVLPPFEPKPAVRFNATGLLFTKWSEDGSNIVEVSQTSAANYPNSLTSGFGLIVFVTLMSLA